MKKVSIRRIKERDEEYFEKIYNEYYSLVKYVVYDILKDIEDTQDICQDVFLTLYEKIDQYEGKNFKYWLLQIAKNKALNHLKKRKLENTYVSQEFVGLANSIDVFNKFEGEIWSILENYLDEEERKIVILKIVFNFSFNEIALELGQNKTYCYRVYKESIKKLNNLMRGDQ